VVTLEHNLYFSPVVFHFGNQNTKHKLNFSSVQIKISSLPVRQFISQSVS